MLGNVLYIALAFYFISFHADANNVFNVIGLKKYLLNRTDKSTTPISDHKQLVVTIFIDVKHAELDEKLEKLTTHLHVILIWEDETMVWNRTEKGIDYIDFDKKEVWVPEVVVRNRHSQISYGIEETRVKPVRYNSTGGAFFYQRITTETRCDLDTTGFPFDRQTCKIKLRVYKHDVVLDPSLNETFLDSFESDGSWDIIKTPTINYEASDLSIEIMLARKPTFIMISLILPVTMLALLSPLVFLLPNKSGERIAYSITVLLATAVFMTLVTDHVPQKSHPFPLVLSMLFILYSLMIFVVIGVIINARIYRLPDHVRIPRFLVWLSRFTRRICCCFRSRPAVKAVDTESEREMNVAVCDGESQSRKVVPVNNVTWKDISWTINMICMTLLYTLKIGIVVVFLFNAQVKK